MKDQLKYIKKVYSIRNGFAAVDYNGKIIIWGDITNWENNNFSIIQKYNDNLY